MGVLGDEKWKIDTIKNYLYFDSILKKTKYGTHQLGSTEFCKDVLRRILINDHPICDGIKQDENQFSQKIYDYDVRLANSRRNEVEIETPTQDSVEKAPEATTIDPVTDNNWGIPEDLFKDLDVDDDSKSDSTTDLIIEVDGIPIIYKNKGIGSISIEGNKIKITVK
jgi:hypothetical protein